MYQELIGELRCPIEIGILDTLHEVSVFSEYQESPQKGHLGKIIHIFGYLHKRWKVNLYFDPQHLKIDSNSFNRISKESFRDQLRDSKEQISIGAP